MKPDHPLTERRIAAIMEALRGPALTLPEVAERVHLCLEYTRRYLRHLHAVRIVYIAAWREARTTRITRIPAYRVGAMKEAPKPAKLTSAQRTAGYRARVRSDAERLDLYLAKARAQRRKPVRDPLVAAMFGAPAARGGARG